MKVFQLVKTSNRKAKEYCENRLCVVRDLRIGETAKIFVQEQDNFWQTTPVKRYELDNYTLRIFTENSTYEFSRVPVGAF